MRNDFLGDSLDMAKRVLIALSTQGGYRVAVYPMPSNDRLDFKLYEKQLGVDGHPNVVVMQHPALSFWKTQRSAYLQWMGDEELNGFNLILLDPDKGVRRNLDKQKNKFLTPIEIISLAKKKTNSLVGVYHHKNADRLLYQPLVNLFRNECNAFAYDFGVACILTVAVDEQKLGSFKSVIEKNLNPGRIRT